MWEILVHCMPNENFLLHHVVTNHVCLFSACCRKWYCEVVQSAVCGGIA